MRLNVLAAAVKTGEAGPTVVPEASAVVKKPVCAGGAGGGANVVVLDKV